HGVRARRIGRQPVAADVDSELAGAFDRDRLEVAAPDPGVKHRLEERPYAVFALNEGRVGWEQPRIGCVELHHAVEILVGPSLRELAVECFDLVAQSHDVLLASDNSCRARATAAPFKVCARPYPPARARAVGYATAPSWAHIRVV